MISIKILNQGAWARTYERQPVSLPRELEDFIPEVEDFYKVNKLRIRILHSMTSSVILAIRLRSFSSPCNIQTGFASAWILVSP